MKIQSDEIERIAGKILMEWKLNHLAVFKASDAALLQRLADIFTREMHVEDDLNRDTEAMLIKYEKQFESGQLDRRKMFSMIKNQLAKERKIVL